jgi:hypothetical protein
MANVTPGYQWTSGEVVTPAKMNSAAAPTVALADNEVTSAKILNGAVTNVKLASDLDASKLTAGTLPDARIGAGAINASRLASDAVETAKILNAAVTPAKLSGAQSGSAPIYGVRAWVNFDGTRNEANTGASTVNNNVRILASGNVTNVIKRGTGHYQVYFTTAMQDANYAVATTTNNITPAGSSNNRVVGIRDGSAKTATDVVLQITSSSGTGTDQNDVSVMVVR